MAEHLASIFGTEKDRVNCPFYFKIGACRHGDRCSRLHTKPTISPTILLSNMYQRPDMNININLNDQPPQSEPPQPQSALDPDKVQDHFEDFYQDLFEELSKYGQIQSLNICDNLADHMGKNGRISQLVVRACVEKTVEASLRKVDQREDSPIIRDRGRPRKIIGGTIKKDLEVGNVYVQFKEEDHAANALMNLSGRFYSGRPIIVDFSPVTDFREATCRQYEENVCNRGGYCNFMHLKKISRELRKQLFGRNKRWNDHGGSRSRSPPRNRAHEEHSHSGRGSGRRDFDRYHGNRDRRPRSRSPQRREKRSRSPADRNTRRTRESSAERRAKIEQWNREKELEESGNKNNTNSNDHDEQGAAQNDSESGDH